MNEKELYQWLMDNGGPVIRYRTATELLPPSEKLYIQQLRDEMIHSPHVLPESNQGLYRDEVPPRVSPYLATACGVTFRAIP